MVILIFIFRFNAKSKEYREKYVYKKGKPARIVPLRNFKPGAEGLGALQLVARYEFLESDEELLDLGYADASLYTDKASGFTVGLNWYVILD